MNTFTLMIIAYLLVPGLGMLFLAFIVSEPDLRTPKMKKRDAEKDKVDEVITKQADTKSVITEK